MSGINLTTIRALVIDDNGFSRRVLNAALRSLNIRQITETENSIDGMAAILSLLPDLIFVDWVMPSIDGLEFAKRLRGSAKDEIRFLPIIMTTSFSEIWRVQQARDVGVNEFVVKPFSAMTLYTKIKSIVDAPRAFVDIADGYFGPDRRRRSARVGEERRKAEIAVA